ncbi:MAG: S-layer homology domain-containing protein [Clostridia bacterium]|nr:S-layer homology domain-containing protein [Clostridia bacterium]
MKKTVKTVSVFLAAVLLLSVCVIAAAAKSPTSFIDVDADRWSYSDIEYAVEKGFLNGVGGGRFAPEQACTRAMVVTVLYRAEGKPEVPFSPVFTDVPSGEWYSDAVIWAQSKGIVNGTTKTTFEPNSKVTREQLATFLFRYASFKQYGLELCADLSAFTDSGKISKYAAEAMRWAVEIGLINGVTKKTIEPRGFATREQFAAIMVRFDKYPFAEGSGVETLIVPID